MGDTTKLNYAANKKYLKASIPSFLVAKYGLKIGDCLKWDIIVVDGEQIIKVTPVKAEV
ncbi:MAG: AbrB family transcriptional regulator [Nitrososphaerota archaeon]|jgi:hypothetical protein|nr:AbrB family transcriptional regulator [Nitrososphaerota archaeon]